MDELEVPKSLRSMEKVLGSCGEKGRDIRSTWALTNAQAKLLKTYHDRFKEHVTPQSN